MQHLPTFKDKVKQYPEHATMALLNYPILMTADILAYKASAVPVGIDQEPHLEVAREIARRMNQIMVLISQNQNDSKQKENMFPH